jgi:hypothetical protein
MACKELSKTTELPDKTGLSILADSPWTTHWPTLHEMGEERLELSRPKPPHFECGASTIPPLAQDIKLLIMKLYYTTAVFELLKSRS